MSEEVYFFFFSLPPLTVASLHLVCTKFLRLTYALAYPYLSSPIVDRFNTVPKDEKPPQTIDD